MGDHRGPVVVAVGDDSCGQTVDWAAAEAAARGCRMHIVHAERLRWTVDPSGLVPVADSASSLAATEHILPAAVSRARSVAPDIEISAESVVRSTVALLVSRARHARLLVLGSHVPPLPRALRSVLNPSVGDRVAGRAACPVAVIRPLPSSAPVGSSPRVVVGVDGSATCAAVLGVAFHAAAQRGVPLTAVHGWMADLPADHEAVCGPVAASEERASLVLDQALEAWRIRFPDVPVETRLPVADPAAALVRASEGAALTVVGCRARGSVRATFFGSVSRHVVQRVRCPVVVVPTSRAAVPGNIARRADHVVDPTGSRPARQRRAPWG
jgi:nucleotide-binding universal stress UspA family protein